ncbi:hypothetical protein CLU88_2411 [Acidovorax sp. 56]|nr:hypothetical protein CLU88_2411 [Acidovorax sp. 56]
MLWGVATLLLPLVLWPMAPVAMRGLRGRRIPAAPRGRDKVVVLALRMRVARAWAVAPVLELDPVLVSVPVQLARAGWVAVLRPPIFRGWWAPVGRAIPALAMGVRWLAATCLRATRPMAVRPRAVACRAAGVVGLLARRGRDSRRLRRGLWVVRRCRGKVWAGALALARAAAKVQGVGSRAWARTWAKVLARGRALGLALGPWVRVCRPRGGAPGACLLVWPWVFRRAFRLAWVSGVMLGLMRRLRSR